MSSLTEREILEDTYGPMGHYAVLVSVNDKETLFTIRDKSNGNEGLLRWDSTNDIGESWKKSMLVLSYILADVFRNGDMSYDEFYDFYHFTEEDKNFSHELWKDAIFNAKAVEHVFGSNGDIDFLRNGYDDEIFDGNGDRIMLPSRDNTPIWRVFSMLNMLVDEMSYENEPIRRPNWCNHEGWLDLEYKPEHAVSEPSL